MSEILRTLNETLKDQNHEGFLTTLCVHALQRCYSNTGQGCLTGSSELDDLCTQAATSISLNYPLPPHPSPSANDLTLYIATELYFGRGGHTPLLLDLIKVDRSKNKELLLTNISGVHHGIEFFEQLSRSLDSTVGVSTLNAETFLEKILIIRSFVAQKKPKRIILLTHQHDVIAYCGLTADMALQIIFITHADTFTLGLHIPWYILVGTNYFAAQVVANETRRSLFCWQIAAEDHGVRPWHNWSTDHPLNTCSHGTGRKFELTSGFGYENVVAMRLELQPGNHYHIGDLHGDRIQKIRNTIDSAGLDPSRFIYVGSVSSLWNYLKTSPIHLCISSYPVCSPKGLVETKGCGIPILIFEDMDKPIRSSVHYAYVDCLRWSNVNDLHNTLSELSAEALLSQARLARQDYEKNHSLEGLGDRASIPHTFLSPNA